MNSFKLNETMRSQLKSALIKGIKDENEWKILFVESGILAGECYDLFYKKEAQDIFKLKDGWLPKKDAIRIKIKGNTNVFKLHFNGLSRFLPGRSDLGDQFPNIEKPFLYKHFYDGDNSLLELEKTHPLSKRLFAIQIAGEKLKETRENIEKEIKTVLFAANTSKQLLELWPAVRPELEKIAPVYIDTPNLPAKRMEALNKTLGLVDA